MPPLRNFEKQIHYQNEPKFNGVYSRNNLLKIMDGDVYSRNNLLKIMDGAYVINLGEFKSIGTHWIDLYVNKNNRVYFDSFGVGHVPKEIIKFLGYKNRITNIYRIQ